MRVSVVIPTYNSARFVTKALDSVLAQTWPLEDIILIDDGSEDETKEVVEPYRDKIRYIPRENGGQASARNLGVEESRGDWVAFLDADDWWAPEKIEKQVEALQSDRDAIGCYTGLWHVLVDGKMFPSEPISGDRLWPTLRFKNPIATSAVMVSRELFLEMKGFDASLKAAEDWDLWARMTLHRRMVSVPEPLVYYRFSDSNWSLHYMRELENILKFLDTSLTAGLSGPEKWAWRRRIQAAAYGRAGWMAQQAGAAHWKSLIVKSLERWPVPGFESWRAGMLTRALVGERIWKLIKHQGPYTRS